MIIPVGPHEAQELQLVRKREGKPLITLLDGCRFVPLISSALSLGTVPRHLLYNSVVPFLRNLRVTLEMIKWEHSIFALPFALCGAMLAANGLPSGQQLLWIIVAMVSARSAAMAFNRLADASIDAANPRTQTRALPAGTLTPAFVATFVVVSCGVFVLAAARLNHLALAAFAGCPGCCVALFLHQTLYALVASGSGIRTGHRAIGGLDCGSRIVRSPHFVAHRGGDLLGRLDSTCSMPVRITNSTAKLACTRYPAISASAARCGSRVCSMFSC